MKKFIILALSIVFITSLIFIGCGEEEEPKPSREEAKYGGVLKRPLTVGPATPIGYPAEGAPDAVDAATPCVDRLIEVGVGAEILPMLATDWEVAPDGKSVTFELRKGVKFHDGSDFNASVVKWNVDKLIEAERGANEWESIEVIDDHTIRINITGYTNTVLTGMSIQCISPTTVEEKGLEYARWHPVGTGPFKFVEYERDVKLIYERNDDYWQDDKPYLDGLEYIVIADETIRNMAFQNGDIHTLRASGLTAQELRDMGYEYATIAGGTFVLIPDSKNAESPFADRRVRLAVSYAINREALAKAVGYGFSKPAYQVYPGFEETRITNLDAHYFDQDKSRQLLAEAGYPRGFKTTIHSFIRVVPRDYIIAIQGMLAEVGIEVDADFPEAGRYTEYRFSGWNNAMMGHAMASFENMNSGFGFYFGGVQFPSVKFPEGWDEAHDKALSSTYVDPVKTQALVRLMHEDVMVIPYLEEVAVEFFQKGIHDHGILTSGGLFNWYPENTWLDPELH